MIMCLNHDVLKGLYIVIMVIAFGAIRMQPIRFQFVIYPTGVYIESNFGLLNCQRENNPY